MKKISVEHLKKRFENIKDTTDFPSPEHELAFKIAVYFDEPYSFWVRAVKNTFLLLGQVEREFEYVKSREWGKRQKVRILMKILFP